MTYNSLMSVGANAQLTFRHYRITSHLLTFLSRDVTPLSHTFRLPSMCRSKLILHQTWSCVYMQSSRYRPITRLTKFSVCFESADTPFSWTYFSQLGRGISSTCEERTNQRLAFKARDGYIYRVYEDELAGEICNLSRVHLTSQNDVRGGESFVFTTHQHSVV